ncbi:MAG: hypothetical protein K2F65_01440 [Eubacterium sp.]|nr:hypothetical protein [Eubacterium sp.]
MSKAKKWSKGKIAGVVILCIAVFLAVLIAVGMAVFNKVYCETKQYTVISISEVTDRNATLIAHRGFSAVAPENTAPAFIEAGLAGFGGAECDVYRTKDGVWVVQHDKHTYRMMDKSSFIESITYEELKTYTTDNGSNIANYPDLKICTLAEYLDICKQYDMVPVIELKGPKNTEHYDEIIASVNDYELADKVVYISFHIENLKAMRVLSDAPLYYLASVIDEEAINEAAALGGKCGIDFDGRKDENTQEIIKQCQDKGLLMGAWTIDKPEDLNRLLDWGVTLITTNAIKP